MILVDTSVWIDHLRGRDAALVTVLERFQVMQHPMVIGELALGTLRDRQTVLRSLARLPSVQLATHPEVMHFVEGHQLYGLGLGLVDAHLLVSVRLTPGARLWTRDRRLERVAVSLDLAWLTSLG